MVVSSLRALAMAGGLAGLTLTAACAQSSAAAPASGAELYGSCDSCHGAAGQGQAPFEIPSIAGLPQWYVTLQLTRFQTDLRGKHPDDVDGLKMRAMSRQMKSEAEISAVASYVASLAPVKNAATIAGDATIGQQQYTLCVACHGAKGEGNEALKAPPIGGMDDWYVAAQIRKFRSGIRGKVPGDTVGPIMQAMSLAIQPENINHLAAYAHSLR